MSELTFTKLFIISGKAITFNKTMQQCFLLTRRVIIRESIPENKVFFVDPYEVRRFEAGLTKHRGTDYLSIKNRVQKFDNYLSIKYPYGKV